MISDLNSFVYFSRFEIYTSEHSNNYFNDLHS